MPEKFSEKREDDNDLLLPVTNSVVFLYRSGEEKPPGPMPGFVNTDCPPVFEDITTEGYLGDKNRHIYA